jgi:hypothetical protein
MTDFFARYRESLPDELRGLLHRYQKKDLAIRPPVWETWGALCAVILMMNDVEAGYPGRRHARLPHAGNRCRPSSSISRIFAFHEI